MKNFYKAVAATMLSLPFAAVAVDNPVANPEAVIVAGNARFTVLTPEMIRIEYSEDGKFEDKATFTVVNRNLEVPEFRVATIKKDGNNLDSDALEDGDKIYIITGKLMLKYCVGTTPITTPPSPDNLSIMLTDDDISDLWYIGKEDHLNLKGTTRTLDGSNGDNKRAEMENGIISRSGWAVIDDSFSATRPDGSRSFAMQPDDDLGYAWWEERSDPDALDIYFMGYGHNYKKALYDFTQIAGRIPLPPAYVFGYWYSKYASYSADDYRNIMAELDANGIPCDVMILDMDWHWNGNPQESGGRGGWTGWSWNTNLIPDPKGLLSDIHSKDYKIALNLHPADGVGKSESPEYFAAMKKDLGAKYGDRDTIPWALDYPDFTSSFFKNVIRDHEGEGVDFWWLDWQQHLTSKFTKDLGETFWCNHVFFNDMKKNRPDRRPVIFHRWGGLGSHRYQIGFSGDAFINFETLAFQPYFTATASNVGYGYWGHDLGGHMPDKDLDPNDPELVNRWLQFGVFTPIFRTHATKDVRIERQIWKFPNFPTMLESVKLRYALFPYIYTMARVAYESGMSICRPLYYDYPEAEEAYTYQNEYLFGDDILVAPVTTPAVDGVSTVEIWFPRGEWWSASTNELVSGPCVKEMKFAQDQIPYFFRQGSMIPCNPANIQNVMQRPDELVINVVAGGNVQTALYEDEFDNSDYAGNFAATLMESSSDNGVETFRIFPRQIVGKVDGLKTSRSYTFNIYDIAAPVTVSYDSTPVAPDSYTYDAATRSLTVRLPSTPCDQTLRLTVTTK